MFTGACLACDPQYTVYLGQCIYCPLFYCSLCMSSEICAQCINGFVVQNSICVCPQNFITITNSSGTYCSCVQNQTFFNGNCVFNCQVPNCISCNSSSILPICQQCAPGYALVNGSCSFVFQFSCNIANCLTCSAPGVCTSCITGYTIAVGGNACIIPNIPNCLI